MTNLIQGALAHLDHMTRHKRTEVEVEVEADLLNEETVSEEEAPTEEVREAIDKMISFRAKIDAKRLVPSRSGSKGGDAGGDGGGSDGGDGQ
jgi:ribosomal protein L17